MRIREISPIENWQIGTHKAILSQHQLNKAAIALSQDQLDMNQEAKAMIGQDQLDMKQEAKAMSQDQQKGLQNILPSVVNIA